MSNLPTLGELAPIFSKSSKRVAVRLSQRELISAEPLEAGQELPLVVTPRVERIDLAAWTAANRDYLATELKRCGAILFRGFQIETPESFMRLAKAISPELLDYSEPSSPRTEISPQIYTSTDYPADQRIEMHNEMSYASQWPHKVFFCCLQPAVEGGATPIASSRKVWELLSPALRERFRKKQVMYVRNFGQGLGMPWQRVFGSMEKEAVERYCRLAGIHYEWRAGDRLRTVQIRQAVLTHPDTGEIVWFNQAHAFHTASLDPVVRRSLLEAMSETDFPRHAYYGDASSIEDEAIAEIREVYARATISFPWRKGDVLLLENMLVSHGRAPFVGPRKILVAMSEPVVT